MNRVRISFIKGGQVVKTFDREANDPQAANVLAQQIATDAGLSFDQFKCQFERRCLMVLTMGKEMVELLETKALDQADGERIAGQWATKAKKQFDRVVFRFTA